MAIGSTSSNVSLTDLRQGAGGVPFGARGSISLGSGLRSGAVLLDAVDRVANELKEARAAAAEAAREAARAEARLQSLEQGSTRSDGETQDQAAVNTSRYGLNDDDAERSINAAQAAGASGESAGPGSFINLAV
ncbi:MAG: hypothetical protein P1U88_00530 [Thalassobaculaceae bacterium]|nr:hypothetical protein [Thalassobaculaceae bacterium]